MPKEINQFFKKESSYANKRKEALEKRQQLMLDLQINQITDEISKSHKQILRQPDESEPISSGPVRKSRRIKGESPEIIPDEFYMRETQPYLQQTHDNEKQYEEEGTILYNGLDPSIPLSENDKSFKDLFKTLSSSSMTDSEDMNLHGFKESIELSGSKKVTPSRIYSMELHPSSDNLLIAAGDKEGNLGFWSLPYSHNKQSLPTLDNGMKDISDSGSTWQFRLSKEPLSRLLYTSDYSQLMICSYDKTIKRFDMTSMKVETVFNGSKLFDSDVFIHHCVPSNVNENCYYISLGNGEIIQIDIRTQNVISCFQAHNKKINTLDIHPNQHNLLTSSLERSVKLFDIRKLPIGYTTHLHEKIKDLSCEECLHVYEHPLSVNSAFFNRTGSMIVTTCQDHHLRVFSTLSKPDDNEQSVSIYHRNNTGKWLTKFMAEWVFSKGSRLTNKKENINYFTCGSLDTPRQIVLYSVLLHDSKQPVVEVLPPIVSPHIASVQSVVKIHPTYPMLTGGNSSGKVVVLMKNRN